MHACIETRFNLCRISSSENSNVKEQTTARTKKPKLQKQMPAFDSPTRQQLQSLKEVLGLEMGSIQFKKRGGGIYHVVYAEGKHHWNHLGSWKELKQKLDV